MRELKSKLLQLGTISLALSVHGKVLAIPNCAPAVSQFRNQADISRLIENAEWIEKAGRPKDKDDRLPRDIYGQKNKLTSDQMEAMFGATGQLDCGNSNGSANVVLKQNVLLTDAHLFWNEKCEQQSAPEICTFTTVADRKPVVRKIKRMAATGYKCPDQHPSGKKDDWAILVLDEPVPKKIIPYGIGSGDQMKKGDNILAVNGANSDMLFADPVTKDRGQTIASCSWLDPMSGYNEGLIATDCSGAPLGSGSAALNSQHQIVGLLNGGSESGDDVAKAQAEYKAALDAYKADPAKNPRPRPYQARHCAYDKYSCSEYYLSVQGDLKSALEAVASETSL